MSKRKRHSLSKRKKSSKCPEPLNSMIDLAAGLTMAAIASSKEKKHNYSARGKINPYAATAVGMATGRIKNTEDIIRTGAILGAMGSFDDDTCNDPLFSTGSFIHTNDNRCAWRLNCEDGIAYGISPEDYETREEYNEALHNEKYGWRDFCEDGAEYDLDPEDFETEEEYEEALEEARETAENESADTDEDTDDGMIVEVDGKEYKAGESIVIHVEEENEMTTDITPPAVHLESTGTIMNADPFADDDFHVYVELSKSDWDAFEISWDFIRHPAVRIVSPLSAAFAEWQDECAIRFAQLKANEEALNRIFIDIYGLQDELTPEVEDKDVTVRLAGKTRDVKSLLSLRRGLYVRAIFAGCGRSGLCRWRVGC